MDELLKGTVTSNIVAMQKVTFSQRMGGLMRYGIPESIFTTKKNVSESHNQHKDTIRHINEIIQLNNQTLQDKSLEK